MLIYIYVYIENHYGRISTNNINYINMFGIKRKRGDITELYKHKSLTIDSLKEQIHKEQEQKPTSKSNSGNNLNT